MSQDLEELRCESPGMYLCAWCSAPIDRPPGNLEGRPTLKHGMCEGCLAHHVNRLAAPPSRRKRRSA